MSWSTYSRNVKLQGHILSAELANGKDGWSYSEIDLNNHVGNDHGHLIPGGGGFYATADHDATKLEGVVLKTRLAKGGDNGGWRDADLDTDVFIANDHGVFKWVGK
ncbi:hypothetical protein M422DRAFT_160063 [Sphaerobolus stellatus SS14]|nr:hypothetical protein M422DRAFT_160063 [Sphaerobolus stellatus SS14]